MRSYERFAAWRDRTAAEEVSAGVATPRTQNDSSAFPSPEYPWSVIYLQNGDMLIAHPSSVPILLKRNGTVEFMAYQWPK